MTEFLSDAWVAQLDARYAESAGSSPEPVTVQYVVATEAGERSYHLVLGPDRDRAIVGQADAADVTFSMNEETAQAISAGVSVSVARAHTETAVPRFTASLRASVIASTKALARVELRLLAVIP